MWMEASAKQMHISATGALVTHQAHLLPHLHLIPERHFDGVEGGDKISSAILLGALNHGAGGGVKPLPARRAQKEGEHTGSDRKRTERSIRE